MSTVERFVDAARSQIGYEEDPGNRAKYGAWYGMDGQAWCAVFTSWCGDRAGVLGTSVPKFACTPSGYRWFADHGRAGKDPRPGSLAFFEFPGMRRVCHVGVVEAVLPTAASRPSRGTRTSPAVVPVAASGGNDGRRRPSPAAATPTSRRRTT